MDNPYKTIESDAAVSVINTKCDNIEASVKELVELVQDHEDMDYRDKEWCNMSSIPMLGWINDTKNRLLKVFIEE